MSPEGISDGNSEERRGPSQAARDYAAEIRGARAEARANEVAKNIDDYRKSIKKIALLDKVLGDMKAQAEKSGRPSSEDDKQIMAKISKETGDEVIFAKEIRDYFVREGIPREQWDTQ